MDDAIPRQTGKTTRQMQSAPPGAHFVWFDSQLYYAKKLAQHLGRTDLTVISAHEFKTAGYFEGKRRGCIVIDHHQPSLFDYRNNHIFDSLKAIGWEIRRE